MQDEQKFFQILVSVCAVLNKQKVRHLVVGGAAVGIHGHYRPTTDRNGNIVDKPDLDIWFHPFYLNYQNMLNAFDDLGFDTSRFREEAHPFPKSSFFRFKPEGYTLDFLPRLDDKFSFGDCYQRRSVSVLGEVEVSIIGLADLIAAKKATGRKKGLDDVKFLEALDKW